MPLGQPLREVRFGLRVVFGPELVGPDGPEGAYRPWMSVRAGGVGSCFGAGRGGFLGSSGVICV